MGGTLLKTKRAIPVHRNRGERDGQRGAVLGGTATPRLHNRTGRLQEILGAQGKAEAAPSLRVLSP